jgi:hypothetical protein
MYILNNLFHVHNFPSTNFETANAVPKRTLEGRPRLRWLDDVESDLKKMEVKGWKEKMRESSGDWL